jgi:pyrimidine-nucleoside phosphorylase
MLRVVDIITKKRDGGELDEEEIRFIVNGLVSEEIPDYQISALLMAIYFQGMTRKETSLLTRSMMNSGDIIDLSGLEGIKLDKHSTGGVGDKVSIVLAPLVASLGIKVPMMAGRGLGHTGGTLDKCEAIPGYSVSLSPGEFLEAIIRVGYGIIGQSASVVPADRIMYALRDVTGTVESIPLITASILSKKCAEGSDGFVFDVKTGSGAFMKDMKSAEALAVSLYETGCELGKKICCVITQMDEPLGYTIGNLLEIREVADCLRGKGPEDVMEVTYFLASRILIMAGLCTDHTQARILCEKQIHNGEAWKKFIENGLFQGGDTVFLENIHNCPLSSFSVDLKSHASGYIREIDAYKVGISACLLGAGRSRKDDSIDPGAGIIMKKKIGDKVTAGEDIAVLYSEKKDRVKVAEELLTEAVVIGQQKPVMGKSKILKEIGV